jgi:hypothetical protein
VTESRVVAAPGSRAPRQLSDGAGTAAAWHLVADRCAASGSFPTSLVASWQQELDAVQSRICALELVADHRLVPVVGLDPGVHALVALANASRGSSWRLDHLVDVAAAVELAYRATCQHAKVADQLAEDQARETNKRHVLDGDWSITQAAVLVAEIGPAAYRLLVRGYGAAQLARLQGGRSAALLGAASSLGALVAGGGAGDGVGAAAGMSPVGARVLAWACEQPAVCAEPARSASEPASEPANEPANEPASAPTGGRAR